MSFSAINTVEQEIRQRNERHSLELQLEKAMNVYQHALEAQSRGEFDIANESYKKLFAYDAVKPQKNLHKGDSARTEYTKPSKMSVTSLQLGPATRLRAMALKNYALLLLSQENVSEEICNEAIALLAESLELVGTDDSEKLVLPSMAEIAWPLGDERFAKLALEQLAENTEGSALHPLEIWRKDKPAAHRLLGPNIINTLQALDYINIHQQGETKSLEKPKMLNKFSNLVNLRVSDSALIDDLVEKGSVTIPIHDLTWQGVIGSLNDTLNSACKRSKRKSHKDAFSWAQRDLWNVTFVKDESDNDEEKNDFFNSKKDANEITYLNIKALYDADNHGIPNEATEIIAEDDSADKSQGPSTPQSPSTPLRPSTPNPTSFHQSPVTPQDSPTPQDPSTAQPVTQQNASHGPTESVATLSPNSNKVKLDNSVFPAKRRRTDRVKRTDLVLPADFGLVDMNFVQQFNLYLELANPDLKMYSPATLFLSHSGDVPDELKEAAYLRDILSKWDQKESNMFLGGASNIWTKPKKNSIVKNKGVLGNGSNTSIELPAFNTMNTEEEDPDSTENLKEKEALEVDQFITSHSGHHIQQIRWALAVKLLGMLSAGGETFQFSNIVFDFIDEIEEMLWSRRHFISEEDITTIFSLYSDRWIKNPKDSNIISKLRRWQNVSSIQGGLEHLWISAFVDQANQDATPESTVAHFEALSPLISNTGTEYQKRFSYLQEIPAITIENAHVQISKFKAAAAFERVLTPLDLKDRKFNDTDQKDEKKIKEVEDIQLLQAMLMPGVHEKPAFTSDSEFSAIQDFLKYAQPQFKMGLWYTLLEKYELSGSASDSLLGLTKIFMETMSALDNGGPLLQTLSVAHDVGKRLVALLERNPDALSAIDHNNTTLNDKNSEIGKLLKYNVRLLQILQMFIVYDDTVNSNLMQKPSTPSWSKVLPKFRELVVIWWCIFYHLWIRCLRETPKTSPETFNDSLSIIHERLGNLGYCGAANGCLLNLHCSEIVRINWEGSGMDLSQCLKCKFGLTLSLYGDVANHHSVPQPVDALESKQLMPLITKMILNHRSFNQLIMRMDTRAVIDEFAKKYVVDDEKRLSNRLERVKQYFNKDFTPRILKNSCLGIIDSSLSFSNSDSASGVWVLQGIVMINQYRMRRRQVYSASSIRIESLKIAMDLFQSDIAAHPYRFESWVSIAQICQYMCEDCLTFGDELSIPNTPDEYCRKALLAASVAVAIKVSMIDSANDGRDSPLALQPELFESLNAVITPLYGYLLYLAEMPPLSKLPFKAAKKPVRPFLVDSTRPKYYQIALKKTTEISDQMALKTSLAFLQKSQEKGLDWTRALYLCHISIKLKLDTDVILSYLSKARECAPTGSHDVDYMLVYAAWVLLQDKKLDEEQALKELQVLPYSNVEGDNTEQSSDSSNEEVENNKVLKVMQHCLRHLIEVDKWMHHARFLLAKIFETNYNDPKQAQEELMVLFSLKSPSKPLVLWTRETDLPGQHSVDLSEYVRYMGDLMLKNSDSAGLLLMTKRFRKTGWEMWNHTSTFERVYQNAINLTRQLIPNASDPKYSDTLMMQYSFNNSEKFEVLSKAMCEPDYSKFAENDPWLKVLLYTTELRKNHSGPATISMADDVVIISYLNIMQEFESKHPEIMAKHTEKVEAAKAEAEKRALEEKNNSTPGDQNGDTKKSDKDSKPRKKNTGASSRKRIIRKDVIVAAQQFLKPYAELIPKIEENGLPKSL